MNTLTMSNALLLETIYALEQRVYSLNHRGSEPTNGAIAQTQAALDICQEAITKRSLAEAMKGKP